MVELIVAESTVVSDPELHVILEAKCKLACQALGMSVHCNVPSVLVSALKIAV